MLSETNEKLINSLRLVVADSYCLLGQIHICHWNVKGPGFFALHVAFEEQYTELFTAIDEIAERIRALGANAPGGLMNLAKLSTVKEIEESADADSMVAHLVECHQVVAHSLSEACAAASEDGDNETEDLMIARKQVHDKSIWMLKSYLG
jgi:starvation-inducible DNA-binding protein